MIVDFIWNSKRSKISYSLLIQDIKAGGLRLADLETRIHTTHISMIKTAWFHPDSTWALVLLEALEQKCIRTLLANKSIWTQKLSPHYSMFRDTLKSWEKFHNFEPDTEELVEGEIVWNNKSILIAQKPVFWQHWSDAGINTIADLLHHQEARFLSHQELTEKFGIPCSFLTVWQIRAAIPVRWKRLIVNPAQPSYPWTFSFVLQQRKF